MLQAVSVPVADITETKPKELAVCFNADMHKNGKEDSATSRYFNAPKPWIFSSGF